MKSSQAILLIVMGVAVSCKPVEKSVVTPAQASWKNYDHSEIRDVRLIRLGEGDKVIITIEPMNRGNVSYRIERIVTKELYDFRDNTLVFDRTTFPFKFYMKFYADFTEGTGIETRVEELEIEIKEKRNWEVKIYV
jgi:hypothetical protein